ncbi:MAG TPA: RNB domain-containing ribonuclease, partial [candidate division Zixibacteria bacterium]
LRSLKKACYQPEDIGHFGLAFRHYTHFTSPIRRYADLVVHRILKSIKNDKYKLDRIVASKERLSQIGKQVSERERLSEEVERESIKLKQMEYLEDKLGEIYQGIITGFLSFGFFVQLNKLLIEGMVRLSSLEDDYYNYDENKGCLVGKHTNKRYTLGQSIEVQVVRVDREQKQVDLVLVEKEGKPRKSKRQISR